MYLQFTWPSFIYPDDTYKRGNPGQLRSVCSFGISTKHYSRSTGFPSYTSVLAKSVILLGLPSASWNIFSNYYYLFDQRSKPGFRVALTLATQGVVWIRCRIWKKKDIFECMQSMSLSLCNSIERFDFSTLYMLYQACAGKQSSLCWRFFLN